MIEQTFESKTRGVNSSLSFQARPGACLPSPFPPKSDRLSQNQAPGQVLDVCALYLVCRLRNALICKKNKVRFPDGDLDLTICRPGRAARCREVDEIEIQTGSGLDPDLESFLFMILDKINTSGARQWQKLTA